MECLFWKKEAGDIDPKIQTVQKILGHKQIFSQLELGPNKFIDNLTRFPESTRTLKSEFICGRYHQNTELDRDNFESDVMT